MPLFFASNAIYPIQIMPGWLQVVARVNPLSYLAVPNAGLDWLVLLAALVVVQLIAGLTFKTIVI